MSVTTKTTMTGERRNTPKPPGRKTRPEGTAAAPGRAGSSHPGSARRASTTSTSTRRTAQKEKVGASSRAATAGSTTRTSTPSRARTTETARPQGAGATRTSRGATLLDAPARFLAYTRGVAGVFEKPSTAQFEANTTSVRPNLLGAVQLGALKCAKPPAQKNVRRWPVLYVNPPAGEAS